jgi:phage baseplate assembly protein W
MIIRYPVQSLTDNAINGRDRVINRLKYLFFTKEGERPMLPNFGITLERYLFENEINISEIELYVSNKIKYWVPEIEKYSVTAKIDNEDQSILKIYVSYMYSGYKISIEWIPSENIIREY